MAESPRPVSPRRVHPWVFMVLIAPFGVMSGYLSVAVGYLLVHAGVSVAAVAGLVALGLLPHTWKFLWAPIADTTLSRKSWYLLSAIVSAAGIAALGILHDQVQNLALFSAIVLIANVASTFLGMSVESLLALTTPDEERGRAGGWFQAGNLGGTGIGGGAGLWVAQHMHPHWVSGALVGGVCFLCCLALFFVPEPPADSRTGGLAKSLVQVGRNLWNVARSRVGFVALVLCFLPIGSGAASGLWSAVAGNWHATADAVALATGVMAGFASAFGCFLGGWFCDRMERKAAYAAYGVLEAVCAVAMALAPRTEAMYVVFTMLYAVVTGMTYAGFTAFVLEAMGLGSAASKYNLFAALSNMPIYYMTSVDGWAYGRWGAGGMLYTEAALGMAGLFMFIVVVSLLPKPKPALAAGPDSPDPVFGRPRNLDAE
ncbi:MAG: MFS transporter [Acidobacteriota bacterium]